MESPLKAIRKNRLKLSTAEFAQLCHCSTASVNYAERGTENITPAILRTLGELRFDVEALRQEHNEFRAEQAAKLRERVERELNLTT